VNVMEGAGAIWPARSTADVDWLTLVRALESAPHATVVVPVYNGGEAVERCLRSVLQHTHARTIVIDDASTDPQTLALLDEVRTWDRVEVVRHDQNLGYTRTANHAIELSGADDLVLLNSDTEVGPGWLERLRWVAYSEPDVATVSAVSDNAGAMAVPVAGAANDWPAHLTWSEVSRAMVRGIPTWAQVVPTGHGFCMYVRRACLDEIGGFDAELFPEGYGEENDFSFRAAAAGWVNLVAPHVMVRHARGVSFGSRRDELMATGRARLDARHPTYTGDIRCWLGTGETSRWRDEAEQVRTTLAASEGVDRRILYVIHRAGGGTPATNLDLMRALADRQDGLLLEVAPSQVRILRLVKGELQTTETWTPDTEFRIDEYWRDDFAELVTRVLVEHGVEQIHIRHLINQPLGTISEVAARLRLPVILSTHDFYLVCPTTHLLDERDVYCGGTCTPGAGACRLATTFLQLAPQPLKHGWVHEWRRRTARVLELADVVVATTPSAARTMLDAHPHIAEKLLVIEHGRDTTGYDPLRGEDLQRRPGPVRVMATARWDPHKGTAYLRRVAELVGPTVEWHILGTRAEQLVDVGVIHGQYERDDFAALAREIDPDLTALFSVCPETYSHTLTESWALGIPVAATDLGAFADRVGAHGGGFIVDHRSPESAAAAIRELVAEPTLIGERLGPPRPGAFRSQESMASDYDTLVYRSHARRGATIGVLAPADRASSHVRIHRRVRHVRQHDLAAVRVCSAADLLSGADSTRYDAVLVQRDTLAPSLGADAVARLRDRVDRIAVDLDDDLLSEGARTRLLRQGYDEARLDTLSQLLAVADVVLVSTDRLRDVVLRHFPDATISVEPNRLDPRLWLTELGAGTRDHGSILYMGTATHDADLELLHGLPERVSELLGRAVRLDVVGVTRGALPAGMRRIPVPKSRYPEFTRWLRGQRGRWSAALAPLAPDEVNTTKSDLKLLEYAMLGLPAVATDFGPYGDRPELASVVSNDLDAWSTAVAHAMQAPERAQRAREWVMEERLLDIEAVRRWTATVVGHR